MNLRLVLLVSIFLIGIPFVSAADITDIQVLFSGHEIETVGPQSQLDVQLQITGTSDADNLILTGELSELSQDPRSLVNQGEVTFVCAHTAGNFTCTANAELWPATPSPAISLSFDEDGELTTSTETLSFTFDNTQPSVERITTGYTHKGLAVVKSQSLTPINITLVDDGSFHILRNIWFVLDSGNRNRAGNCNGMSCSGFLFSSCPPGTQQPLTIVFPSSDDAGNPVQNYRQTVLCDGENPLVLEQPSYSVVDGGVFSTPKAGDVLEFSLLVQDDATAIAASATFGGLIANNNSIPATCVEQEGNTYNCTWTVPNINAGDYEVNITVEDGVDNKVALEPLLISVDEFISASEMKTPLFFGPVRATTPVSSGYNRITIDLAVQNGMPFPIFAGFDGLQRSGMSQGVESIFMETDPYECTIRNSNGVEQGARSLFSEIAIANPQAGVDTANRLDMTFAMVDMNTVPDLVQLTCNVSVFVRDNGITYEQPTHFPLMVDIRFQNTAIDGLHIGEVYASQIREREERINGSLMRTIEIANRVAATFTSICDVLTALGTVDSTGATLQATGAILSATGIQIGDVLVNVGSFINGATDLMTDPASEAAGNLLSDKQDLLAKACEYATCSNQKNAENNMFGDWYFTGGTTLGDISFDTSQDGWSGIANDLGEDVVGNLAIPDPSNSIISSVATQCWPGVVYHLNRYREASCETLLCMKEVSRQGLDPTICEQAEAQFICQEVIGEVFEAVPYTRMAENLAENVQGLARNIVPKTLQYVMDNTLCSGWLKSKGGEKIAEAAKPLTDDAGNIVLDSAGNPIPGSLSFIQRAQIFACEVPGAVGGVLDTVNSKNGNQGNFVYPNQEEICVQALCNNPEGCSPRYASYLDRRLPSDGTMQNLLNNNLPINTNEEVQDPAEIQKQITFYETTTSELINEKTNIENSRKRILGEINTLENRIDAASIDPDSTPNPAWENQIRDLEQQLQQDQRRYENINQRIEGTEQLLEVQRENYARALEGLPPISLYDEYSRAMERYEVLQSTDPNVNYEYFARAQYGTIEINRIQYEVNSMSLRELRQEYQDLFGIDRSTTQGIDIDDLRRQIIDRKVTDNANELSTLSGEEAYLRAQGWPPERIQDFTETQRQVDELAKKLESTYIARQAVLESSTTERQDQIDAKKAEIQVARDSGCNSCVDDLSNELNELNKAQAQEQKELNRITDATATTGPNPQARKDAIELLEVSQRRNQEIVDNIQQLSTTLANTLYNYGVLDFLVWENWLEEPNEAVNFIDTALDTDAWKAGMCGPLTRTSQQGSVGSTGGAIQCEGSDCNPVLGQAAERLFMESTEEYLYTFAAQIGPYQGEFSYQYSIFVVPASGEKKHLFSEEVFELVPGQSESIQTSFMTENIYEQVCIQFINAVYPPGQISAEREYCVSIADVESGESAFDTGSPVSPTATQDTSVSVSDAGVSDEI